MELDENPESGNSDPGYDIVSSCPVPDQEDMYFPKEETEQDVPLNCQWVGNSLSAFDQFTQVLEPDDNASAVHPERGIKPDDSTPSIQEENGCTDESEGVSVVPWLGFLKPPLNFEVQMEAIELDRNLGSFNVDLGYDFVSSYAIPDQEDTIDFLEEGTGEGLPFRSATESDSLMQTLELDSDATAVYHEGGIKPDDSILSMPEENNCTGESEAVSLVAFQECLKPVSNLEEKTEENVEVEGLPNTDVKVVEHMRKGPKILEIDVYEKRENCRIPTYYNLKTFPDAENDETVEYNGTLEPNSVGTSEEKEKNAASVLDSSPNVAESDRKGIPDVDCDGTSNTGDESLKGKVPVGELNLKAVEKTITVLKGQAVDLKALTSLTIACAEKTGYIGDFGKAEKADEDGTGERPVLKGSSKKKKKKDKAQKSYPTSKKSANRIERMNEQSTPLNSYASHMKSASENSYARGITPEVEPLMFKDVLPANENFNARGSRPSSERSFARGFHPGSENSYLGGSRHRSDESYGRGICPASENSYISRFRPSSEPLFGRGLRPTTEHVSPKGVLQACGETLFRPACENSFGKRFEPVSDNLRANAIYRTTGNWFATDNQPANMNHLSRERNISFSDILIAKRENSASYQKTLRETKHINMRCCSSPAPILISRLGRSDMPKPLEHFGASRPVPMDDPAGTRKVAVVKPIRPKDVEMVAKRTPGDFVEMLLSTDNMFESRSAETKKVPFYEQHENGFLGEGGNSFQKGASKESLRKGRGQYSEEGSAERGFKAGCRQWPQSPAGRLPDYNRSPVGLGASAEMEPPPQLKYVNWIQKEDVGHFFASGLTTLVADEDRKCGRGHSPLDFLTFDELVLLNGLETAVVSITDSIETAVAKGFVARFPASCNLHLLVNEDVRIYPEFIIVCCSCPKLIIAHQVGAVKSCPKCRFVRLTTYPEMKIKCQFMLLRSAHMLRFVLLSSSMSMCDWETRLQFGWFHDFPAVQDINSNCYVSPNHQNSPFWRDLTEFLTSMEVYDLNVFSGVDFSNVSPALRLIHTKPGVCSANDPYKYGAAELQKIIKRLVWKLPKKRESLYKTERLGKRCHAILNDVFPKADLQTSVKHLKVVYPSFRWINECLANSESSERLTLLPTVRDIHSVGDLPWNFLYDLCESKDFVQNYNVLMQYENWEQDGKMRKYGWFLTGSQALDTESWGEDYPVYHKVMYKHFQLSVGFFPFLRRNEISQEVEVCAVDLCDIPLPFDPVAMDHYRLDDMPRLVLGSGQNIFCHCVGLFVRAKSNFGFIRESPVLKGLLDPFPAPKPGQQHHDVFLHMSSLSPPELPADGSVIEFFFLNQPPTNSSDFIRVCRIFSSIEEARFHFLFTMPGIVADEAMLHKEMVQCKALSLGIEWIDNVKQMEDAIEDYYNATLSPHCRGFTYFPTQQEIDAISIEPVKILSDTDWVTDYYKSRRNRGGLTPDVGPCRPRVLLANFYAMKNQFVQELHEATELNQKLEEENQGSIPKSVI